MVRVRSRMIAVTATLALSAVTLLASPAGVVRAQDATPVGNMAGMGTEAGLPNHIHSGTCDNLGEVVVPLAELAHATEVAGEAPAAAMATPMAAMAGEETPVLVAVTKVDLPLADIIAGGHAIQIHEAEDLTKYVACGNILGTPTAGGDLFVGLKEQNDSGMAGIAWLHNVEGDGTTVTVMLAEFAGHHGGA